MEIVERLGLVHDRIRHAGGDPERLTIVAVTKGFGVDAIRVAAAAGLGDVGENYIAEMASKMAPARLLHVPLRWHFLGHVQRNKVGLLAPLVHLWHGVDRLALGEELAGRRPGAAVLVQVDLTGDARRNGCQKGELDDLVEGLRGLPLDVRGLMAVAPRGRPEDARPHFRWMAAAAVRLGLPEVSMGMTDDLEVAVQEGSTMVRVGRALFGARPERAEVRR